MLQTLLNWLLSDSKCSMFLESDWKALQLACLTFMCCATYTDIIVTICIHMFGSFDYNCFNEDIFC